MNVWENAVLTQQGRSLLAKLTQGNTLNLTRAVTGSGYVVPGVLGEQTAVSEPKQELVFKPVSYPSVGKCGVPVELSNAGLVTGYTARQVGIFASDPDAGEILFLIVQSITADTGTIIPSETESPGYGAQWKFYIQYGQADGVNVTVDPSNTVSYSDLIPITAAQIKMLFGE